tara:strand:- start:586 stop:774 length:189 start_codon:yes stop_codon:yes gene_type:complete
MAIIMTIKSSNRSSTMLKIPIPACLWPIQVLGSLKRMMAMAAEDETMMRVMKKSLLPVLLKV